MRSQSLFWLGALLFFASNASVLRTVDGDNLASECSNDSRRKANTPTKDCCGAVQTIKDSEPKCLCYIIQQAHNGSTQFKNLGIQEAKMLQLPTACKLQNASLSFCPSETAIVVNRSSMLDLWLEKHPVLLGLSPGSSDAAIFTNVSTSATPAASTGSGTSQPDNSGDSGRIKQRPALAGLLMIVAAIFVFAFPAGSASMFQLVLALSFEFSGFHPILFAVVVILSSTLISAMVVVKAIIYDLRVLISGF
ncbi:GPI-anchored protein [Salix suchowensis]|nr:GPI-anchored protein [Salix suchowensis]